MNHGFSVLLPGEVAKIFPISESNESISHIITNEGAFVV